MKKTIITVFAVLAVASVAGAQEAAWNFDGQKGPVPVILAMERAQAANEPAPAAAAILVPQRVVIIGKVKKEELGALLRAARRGGIRGTTLACSFAGPVEGETQVCGSECCDVDMDGDGEGDMTDCHLIPPCFPIEDPKDKSGEKTESGARALKIAASRISPETYEAGMKICNEGYAKCAGEPGAELKGCYAQWKECADGFGHFIY